MDDLAEASSKLPVDKRETPEERVVIEIRAIADSKYDEMVKAGVPDPRTVELKIPYHSQITESPEGFKRLRDSAVEDLRRSTALEHAVKEWVERQGVELPDVSKASERPQVGKASHSDVLAGYSLTNPRPYTEEMMAHRIAHGFEPAEAPSGVEEGPKSRWDAKMAELNEKTSINRASARSPAKQSEKDSQNRLEVSQKERLPSRAR